MIEDVKCAWWETGKEYEMERPINREKTCNFLNILILIDISRNKLSRIWFRLEIEHRRVFEVELHWILQFARKLIDSCETTQDYSGSRFQKPFSKKRNGRASLWVMGPTRFHCATLLLLKHSQMQVFTFLISFVFRNSSVFPMENTRLKIILTGTRSLITNGCPDEEVESRPRQIKKIGRKLSWTIDWKFSNENDEFCYFASFLFWVYSFVSKNRWTNQR